MKRRTIFLALVLLLVAGCGPTPAPEPNPTPAPPQPIQVRTAGFADYVPVVVDVAPQAPTYTPDLDSVTNPDLVAWMSDAQREALERNGFVVVPQGPEQIYQIYQSASDSGKPVFVTTDAVLHAYHVLYDYALRMAEQEYLMADLEALTDGMLEAAQADYEATSGPVQEAARQNVAFFAVARKLLDPSARVPALVRDEVNAELDLIEAHEGASHSPIFGYREDYSQYVPRGHYTRNEDFERYFRAMMWYGRISYHLTNPEDPEAAKRETRAALLIVRALYNAQVGDEAALDIWERIYEPTAFFVGTADDLTVYEYAEVAQEVYGGLPDPATLADEAQLEEMMAAARELRPPRIVGGYVTDAEDPEEVTQGFRFMGRRFIPDSYMFQQLVYDQVDGYQGTGTPFTISAGGNRVFPRALDIPAVLGSERALEIMEAAGDTDYRGYDEQLEQLQSEFAELPEEQWTENLYWGWLHTLRPLLEMKGEGYPYFMQSSAWVDKDLHTWLGSWTELRHDTILYAKQSYAVLESAMPQPELPSGYVEPQPEVYARLAALTAQMRAGLGERGLLDQEMGAKLDGMERLLLLLKEVSERELRGESLTEDQYAAVRSIGDTLEGLTTFSEEVEGEITSEADERMALIADVHTDPNSSQVLEEGVGDAFTIYVVVPIDGQQVVTTGGVFSYYEFKWPMDDRLTDEAWQEMSPRPDRPGWTSSFIVE